MALIFWTIVALIVYVVFFFMALSTTIIINGISESKMTENIKVIEQEELTKDFEIGETLFDTQHGVDVVITNKTSSSIEIFHKKLSEHGIDCKNWHEYKLFLKRFKKK